MGKIPVGGELTVSVGSGALVDILPEAEGVMIAEGTNIKLVFELVDVIIEQAKVTRPGGRPPAFGQCQSPWANWIYSPSGTLTFCRAGCLATSLASLAAWAGYDTDPARTAESLGLAGAFEGDLLSHPDMVTRAFEQLVWRGRSDNVYYSPLYDCNETSYIDWHDRAVDLKLLRALLDQQPIVLEVDYRPKTAKVDQHFVLGWQYRPDPAGGIEDDLTVMDPISGTYTSVLTYFNPDWLWERALQEGKVTKVARTVMGARVWEVVGSTEAD